MGFPPPPNGPPPGPATVGVTVGMVPSLPAVALCGFAIPSLFFKFGFQIPALGFPPPIPFPHLALGINCSLSNPLSVSAGLSYGGGRTSNADPDPDLQEQQAA